MTVDNNYNRMFRTIACGRNIYMRLFRSHSVFSVSCEVIYYLIFGRGLLAPGRPLPHCYGAIMTRVRYKQFPSCQVTLVPWWDTNTFGRVAAPINVLQLYQCLWSSLFFFAVALFLYLVRRLRPPLVDCYGTFVRLAFSVNNDLVI